MRLVTPDDAAASQMLDGVRMPTEITMHLVVELLPYVKNSRNHTPLQIEAIARSMQEVGFTNPLLIADGGILAGHGRLMAAKKLGLTRVPCIDLSHLDEDQRRALVIWDNRSAELGSTWDLEMLKLETDYLREAGHDLEAVTGFSEVDLAKLFEGIVDPIPEGGGDPDDVPDVPALPASEPGDVWVLGDHRIMCGSSLDPKDWDKLMAGEQASVVWTDPPFNVDIGEKNRSLDRADGGQRAKSGEIKNDKMPDKDFYLFLHGFFVALLEHMKPGAPIYVAHPEVEAINFRTAFRDAGFKQQGTVVWNKNSFVIGRFDHQPRTETILYGWKPGAAHKWYGGRKVTNVLDLGEENPFKQMEDGRWQVRFGDTLFVIDAVVSIEQHASDMIHEARPAKSDLHPTMKPVNLIARQLKNSGRRGDIAVDGFGGSGSTAIAAHQLGMKARLMELDPKFCDVCVSRLERFTGMRAVHAVTGRPFPREGDEPAPAPASAAPVTVDEDPDIF